MTGRGTERTDPSFWDKQWAERARRSFGQSLLRRADTGRSGAFLRTWREAVGGGFVRDRSVAEIGGAMSGRLVDLAKWESARVTAIDYSKVGIEQTRTLFAQEGVHGDVIHANVFEWNEGVFDVVTHWGVLEHFDDPVPMLLASARLVRPGGTVVFSMPNLAAVGATLWSRFSPQNFAAHVFHSDEAVRVACRTAGLILQRCFVAGVPLVRMAPLERGGLIQRAAINAVHVILCLAGTVAPGLYQHTPKSLASMRYFVAIRAGA